MITFQVYMLYNFFNNIHQYIIVSFFWLVHSNMRITPVLEVPRVQKISTAMRKMKQVSGLYGLAYFLLILLIASPAWSLLVCTQRAKS